VRPAADQLGDLAGRIVEVPEAEGEERAVGHAGGLEPLLDPVDAEGALLDHALRVPPARRAPPLRAVRLLQIRVLVRRGRPASDGLEVRVAPVQVLGPSRRLPVEVVDAVGAGDLAVPAADAAVGVGGHEAVRPLEARPDRAHLHAGRVVAVHARPRQEPDARAGELPLLEPEHVHPERGLRRVVLHLAGLHAGAAARTAVQVDDHGVPRHRWLPSQAFQTFTRTWKDWSAVLAT